MATILPVITDLDDLGKATWSATEAASGFFQSDEFWLDAVNRIFYFKGAGNFANAGSGVTGQALYSFFKDRWKTDTNLPQYPFPMLSITNEQFEFQNGWKPANGELVGTDVDIAFNDLGPDTITSTAIDLSVFSSADHVIISGSGSNDGYYRVASAVAGTITLEAGETLTTEGAGATVSIYRNAVYQSGGEILTTREMIRTAGWSEVEQAGGVSRRYSGVVTLGALDGNDQPYYVQDAGFNTAPIDTSYAGIVNQAVQWYGNVDFGDTAADDFVANVGTVTTGAVTVTFSNAAKTIDFGTAHAFEIGDLVKISGAAAAANNQLVVVRGVPSANVISVTDATLTDAVGDTGTTGTLVGYVRDDYFKIFVRTRKKTYADADLVDIGVSSLTYIVYRFPLTNADDLNVNTTGDAAFTGATISSITGNGTTITVTTSAAHGLYAGAPVLVSGTGVANFGGAPGKLYTIAALDGGNPTTVFTITSSDTGSASVGTTILGYTDDISIKYMVNPQTQDGDVVLKGDWAAATTYALGDVAFDVANSKTAVGGPQWYYVSATTGDSAGANLNADTGNTWTLWDSTILFGDADSAIGAFGGQRNIEEDASATLSGPTDGNWSAYTIEIDGNAPGATDAPGATKETIYEYAQYKLRQTVDINDTQVLGTTGSVRRGDIADPLVFFVGATLNTYRDPTIPSAVLIDDIAAPDVNNIQYNEALAVTYDGATRSTIHASPVVVTVTFNFNNNLAQDVDSIFYAYYTAGEGAQAGNDYGTTGALEVQRVVNGVESDVGSDVSNNVPANGVYQFNYAFDADVTSGRTGGTDTSITVVAIGLETGQYVSTSGSITNTGGTFSLVAPLERNFIDE